MADQSWIKKAKKFIVNGQEVFVIPNASLTCRKCGRVLRGEKSIERGLGPCCAKLEYSSSKILVVNIKGSE